MRDRNYIVWIRRTLLARGIRLRGVSSASVQQSLSLSKCPDPLSNSPGANCPQPVCLFPPSWFLPPTAQNAASYHPGASDQDPGGGYEVPRGLQERPKRAQESSRASPKGLKSLQELSRSLQEVSRGPQEVSKSPLSSPKYIPGPDTSMILYTRNKEKQ